MNLTPEVIISGVGMILSIGIAYGITKAHIMDQRDENKKLWNQIQDFRKKYELVEREMSSCRLTCQRDISDLRVNITATDGKFAAILEKLESLSESISKLEGKMEDIKGANS